MTEKVELLKMIDFNLFVIILRLYLFLYQMIIWLKDEIYLFYQQVEVLVNLSQIFPIKDDLMIDSNKFKNFLSR
jgi:hypothetical protein